jgi:hypothetical protein
LIGARFGLSFRYKKRDLGAPISKHFDQGYNLDKIQRYANEFYKEKCGLGNVKEFVSFLFGSILNSIFRTDSIQIFKAKTD